MKDERVLSRMGLDSIGRGASSVRWVDVIRHAALWTMREQAERVESIDASCESDSSRKWGAASSARHPTTLVPLGQPYSLRMHYSKQQLDLLHLFPAASTSTSAPVLVDTPSIAFVGQLPAATPLHLALNHLHREEEKDGLEDEPFEGGLSERARGKQRAGGDGHGDEEPRDDARSQARQPTPTLQRRVLILTPDRDALREQLVEQCDGSLAGDRLDGSEQALLDRIDIR